MVAPRRRLATVLTMLCRHQSIRTIKGPGAHTILKCKLLHQERTAGGSMSCMKALKIIPLTQEDQLRKEVMQSSALRPESCSLWLPAACPRRYSFRAG